MSPISNELAFIGCELTAFVRFVNLHGKALHIEKNRGAIRLINDVTKSVHLARSVRIRIGWAECRL